MAQSQTIPIHFDDCKTDEMFVQTEVAAEWANDTISLVDYLNKHIADKNLSQIAEGRILIGILIYPDGKPCCHTFGNLTKLDLSPAIFKEAIDRMPYWLPAKHNGTEVAFLKNQVFTIRNGKFL